MSPTDNPYQAPQTHEYQEPTLSEDSEFLISFGEILCRETVELPKVCVQTGATADLVQRQKTFLVPRYRISGLTIAVAVIAMIVVTVRFGFGFSLGIVFSVLAASVVIGSLYRRSMVQVSVTWYVGNDYLRRCRKQERLIRCMILLMTTGFGILVAWSNTSHYTGDLAWNVFMGLGFGLICGLPCLFLKMERPITSLGRRIRGPHKGLYSLTGHSRRFTEAVELIIQGQF